MTAQERISHSGGGDSGCIDLDRCMDLNVDFVVAGNDSTHDNKNLELGQPCQAADATCGQFLALKVSPDQIAMYAMGTRASSYQCRDL